MNTIEVYQSELNKKIPFRRDCKVGRYKSFLLKKWE